VDRRAALVVLWAVFAAAAVGVGFAAAGLVGDPFTAATTDVLDRSPRTGPAAPPPATTSTTPSPGTSSATASPGGGRPPTRSLNTRAGLVSATCQGGLVRLSASPAVGWGIEDIDADPRPEGRVRFERDEDGRVEVRASCAGDVATFTVDDDGEHGGGDE
jgi:hypothetical protein